MDTHTCPRGANQNRQGINVAPRFATGRLHPVPHIVNQFLKGDAVCHRLYSPPPLITCELLPCPAGDNRTRRLCSITEKTRGQIEAGVSNPGAGAITGAGAGTGGGATVVLLKCYVKFPEKRCPTSSMAEITNV